MNEVYKLNIKIQSSDLDGCETETIIMREERTPDKSNSAKTKRTKRSVRVQNMEIQNTRKTGAQTSSSSVSEAIRKIMKSTPSTPSSLSSKKGKTKQVTNWKPIAKDGLPSKQFLMTLIRDILPPGSIIKVSGLEIILPGP